ncbi:hypothetical protein T11_5446 [Trichinella zimbabwensis]|uniref:Uncharacterized protein n=1 Tax=Trichinella zimbabwensis TaxID=268475 RepID=A0A0V1H2K7_9BILA|nr:hypothetical protein T11_5446 [Trichinella zimbabwensis]
MDEKFVDSDEISRKQLLLADDTLADDKHRSHQKQNRTFKLLLLKQEKKTSRETKATDQTTLTTLVSNADGANGVPTVDQRVTAENQVKYPEPAQLGVVLVHRALKREPLVDAVDENQLVETQANRTQSEQTHFRSPVFAGRYQIKNTREDARVVQMSTDAVVVEREHHFDIKLFQKMPNNATQTSLIPELGRMIRQIRMLHHVKAIIPQAQRSTSLSQFLFTAGKGKAKLNKQNKSIGKKKSKKKLLRAHCTWNRCCDNLRRTSRGCEPDTATWPR